LRLKPPVECIPHPYHMYTNRGCIDKNLRKNISSKIKFEVWKL